MFNFYKKESSGFTLIELLVVVSIIGLLSSIVLASLNTARKKGKDAAIKQSVRQFENLLALEYNETGSYCNLQPISGTSSVYLNYGNVASTLCENINFAGGYANNARQICKNLESNAIQGNIENGSNVAKGYIGTSPSVCSSKYSIMIYLNSGKWYCSGSNGKGEYSTFTSGGLGCYNNP